MARNRLAAETSPYLLQHADNPVDWWPWGTDALAEAARTDRPILLSIGYAACHWCHVMAHESFENADIAAVMNRLFVNIKVDREERPDLDHIYQSALALMGQSGGWPLTMFLTPAGEPFWGGTYFPATPRYGRPGFAAILERVAALYRDQRAAVEQNRGALMQELARLAQASAPAPLPANSFARAAERLLALTDPRHGGLGGAPKFPQPFVFEFLWRIFLESDERRLGDAVTRTLDHLSQGGIYDHLGGGFARYAVDERWHIPHFEKMLYDNALVLRLLALVWPETRSPLYAERAAGTVAWLLREMRLAGGAFAASIDADSDGGEGRFYVWTADEIARLLPPADFPLFAAVYGVRPEGNWEGVNILHRLDAMTPRGEAEERRLARCRDILFAAREKRRRPARDDKILADWNGLAIRALAEAAMVFCRPDWLDAADTAFTCIRDTMCGPDGRLLHAARDDRVQPVSLLDDHAQMIAAALTLHECGRGRDTLDAAIAWAERVEDLFLDRDHGGYFTTARDAPALILRPRSAHDTAQPSGNATMLENFARLYHLTGEARWRSRADALVAAFSADMAGNPVPVTGLLNGYHTLCRGAALALPGAGAGTDRDSLSCVAWEISFPGLVRRYGDATAADGVAVLCRGTVCGPAIRDPVQLGQQLRDARRQAS